MFHMTVVLPFLFTILNSIGSYSRLRHFTNVRPVSETAPTSSTSFTNTVGVISSTLSAMNKTRSHNLFPECTPDQLSRIRKHLPPHLCVKARKRPWAQQCSFTHATKCVRATWLTDYYTNLVKTRVTAAPEHFIGISVGCNKGMDALDTLRMGTSNEKFDKAAWWNAMQSDGAVQEPYCEHEKSTTNQFPTDRMHKRSGEMHCIEAFPSNYLKLKYTAERMGIDQEGFHVTHAAMTKNGTKVAFPTPNVTKAGVENLSISACAKKTAEKVRLKQCQEVDSFTLETFVEKHITSKGPIHVLSIDVEGYDYDVMMGGIQSVLDRVQYLEFEYNWMGAWAQQKLSDAIQMLEVHGFNCYWAGDDVLYRIGGCWQDYYNIHFFSNVACVHHTQQELAHSMENTFLRTLTKNYTWTEKGLRTNM